MKTIYRWLCVAVGALLGAGCDSDDCGPEIRSATVLVDGEVVDQFGTPVADVHVAFAGGAADTTGADGTWSIVARGTVPADCVEDLRSPCMLEAHEVGHPDGNLYLPFRTALDLEQVDDGDGNFDLGVWVQRDIRVVMRSDVVLYGPACAARAWLKTARSGPV